MFENNGISILRNRQFPSLIGTSFRSPEQQLLHVINFEFARAAATSDVATLRRILFFQIFYSFKNLHVVPRMSSRTGVIFTKNFNFRATKPNLIGGERIRAPPRTSPVRRRIPAHLSRPVTEPRNSPLHCRPTVRRSSCVANQRSQTVQRTQLHTIISVPVVLVRFVPVLIVFTRSRIHLCVANRYLSSYCMSQKIEKPVLSGQRIKTRKRDEKEKYDPYGFRDYILGGLNGAGTDLEAIWKFLDQAGSKVDYRRYGEVLFDILIAGGLLVPGGSISQDGSISLDGDKVWKTNACVFEASEDMVSMRNYEQVFIKLMRRYKYLEKMFEEEMKKILLFIKGFSDIERVKLARMTTLWIANGSIPPTVLQVLTNEHLIKDGLALEFLIELFVTYKQEVGNAHLLTILKKGGLESRLMDFLPTNKRTEENLRAQFEEKGLGDVVKLHLAQASQEAKRNLEIQLHDDFNDNKNMKEIISNIKELSSKHDIPEHEIIVLVWSVVMRQVEWNKKEELLADQALKHLRMYSPLFSAFSTTARSELALMLKVQEYCYENMNFMRVFQKIILLFYKTDVLTEEVILKWYKEGHSKGKTTFLEQMKKFIEWLQNAEEESESGEDED